MPTGLCYHFPTFSHCCQLCSPTQNEWPDTAGLPLYSGSGIYLPATISGHQVVGSALLFFNLLNPYAAGG